MVEYIEREAALALAESEEYLTPDGDEIYHEYIPVSAVKSIHAADVKPVVRGRWRFEEGDGETCSDGWVCSACGCGFHTHVPYFEDFNFCPNCGADMREER